MSTTCWFGRAALTLFFAVSCFGQVPAAKPKPAPVRYRSRISVYDVKAKSVQVVYTAETSFEAPNWSRDGKFLLVNSGGSLYRLPLNTSGAPALEKIDVGEGYSCNNDHDISKDGKRIAFSASTPAARTSQVFVANIDGSGVRQITPKGPSYFHGWSPDGLWLTFVANRGVSYDVYRVLSAGGEEQQLTSDPAYDDGSEYSPDGKWIYFNSNRGGGWNIWRLPPDGAGPKDAKAEQVTSDEQEDWFPHVAPNGKSIVFLSFPPGTANHGGRMNIQLRMISAPGGKVKPAKIETLLKIFGGQGTINVNSWSPDSKKFAFVSYEVLQ